MSKVYVAATNMCRFYGKANPVKKSADSSTKYQKHVLHSSKRKELATRAESSQQDCEDISPKQSICLSRDQFIKDRRVFLGHSDIPAADKPRINNLIMSYMKHKDMVQNGKINSFLECRSKCISLIKKVSPKLYLMSIDNNVPDIPLSRRPPSGSLPIRLPFSS